MTYNVVFQPEGLKGCVQKGKSILEAARDLGVDIDAPCGGSEICGKCKVKIGEGYFEKYGIESKPENLSPVSKHEITLLTEEELAGRYRLACCTKIMGDVVIFVPDLSGALKQVILETGRERAFNLNPNITKYHVRLTKPTLEDYRDDARRLIEGLQASFKSLQNEICIDYYCLLDLPDILRKSQWNVTATLLDKREIIAVEEGNVEKAYGIAIDLGTTTIAAYLCDLTTGEVLIRDSMVNPQVCFGDDVVSRITRIMNNEDGLKKMNFLIIEELNRLIERMAEAAGITPKIISEVVMVCNTAMHHIALNINPAYMGCSPFTSVVRSSLDIKARDLGLNILKGGNVHLLPIEAGFVGADNMAVLISEEPYKQDKRMLIIDIGTNGEIALGNKNRLLVTSCATGPALEGAQIKHGMRAASGAIEGVRIHEVSLEPSIKIIGDDKWHGGSFKINARGICGSGIIDAVAQLIKSGIVDKNGTILKNLTSPRIRKDDKGKMEYVLVWSYENELRMDITITQKDIRAVQLAKAALYAGARILLKKSGFEGIDEIVLAGAFGSFINKESALTIGMFPDCGHKNIISVGNAAGEGAKMALLDKDKRNEARELAGFIEFVEAAVDKDFQEYFCEAMSFHEAKDGFIGSKKSLGVVI
jgi:uncharacterized 2Fe-2S/4Fe-4S cluster protein (DUF4445 family)